MTACGSAVDAAKKSPASRRLLPVGGRQHALDGFWFAGDQAKINEQRLAYGVTPLLPIPQAGEAEPIVLRKIGLREPGLGSNASHLTRGDHLRRPDESRTYTRSR
jgi:hypothetical protein